MRFFLVAAILLSCLGSTALATTYTWDFGNSADYYLAHATWAPGMATVPSQADDEDSVFARLNTQTYHLGIGDVVGGGYTVTGLNNTPGTIYGSLYLSPTGGSGSDVLILISPMSWTGAAGNYTYTFNGSTHADYRTWDSGASTWTAYDPARSGTFDQVKAMLSSNTGYAAFFGPQIGMSGTHNTTFGVTQIQLKTAMAPWKVATVHGTSQFTISEDGSSLLYHIQPQNTSNWFWTQNNGSPAGTLATGGAGPLGQRTGSKTFALTNIAAGTKLNELKLEYDYLTAHGNPYINFFMTDGRGKYGIYSPMAGGNFSTTAVVDGSWTHMTMDLTRMDIGDSSPVAVYEHNGLTAVTEPFTIWTWGDIKNFTVAGMYDYQRSPANGWSAWSDAFANVNSTWNAFRIRNATGTGNPALINDLLNGGVLVKEFVITEAGMKAGWGTSALDGKKVQDIPALSIARLNPLVGGAPYINIWVTGGAGKYAILAVGVSDWDLSAADLMAQTVHVYESTDQTWLANGQNVGTLFNFADYTILPPTPAEFGPLSGIGGGAPRELLTNKAYGINWVFGDTLNSYVAGEGYLAANPSLATGAPAYTNGYGIAIIDGDTVGPYSGQPQIRNPLVTFGGNSYVGTFEDAQGNWLKLAASDTCIKPSETVVITLSQSDMVNSVWGVQAFMSFDPAKLSIGTGNILVAAPSPYTQMIWKDVTGGNVSLAPALPNGTVTAAPSDVATLTFTAVAEGTTTVGFRSNTTPPTQFTDLGGNPFHAGLGESVTITVDGTNPSIACPPAVTVQCIGDVPAAATDLMHFVAQGGTATDANGVTLTHVSDISSGTCPTVITRTYKATDCAGNSSTCEQVITVRDTTAPEISCPGNFEVQADAGTCGAAVTVGTATATDNCTASPEIAGVRSDSKALGVPYPVGVTTITWTATDACNNSSTCYQTVKVANTTTAVISVQLEGVTATVTRKRIRFDFGASPSSGSTMATRWVDVLFPGSVDPNPNIGTATINDVPACVAWTCVTAKDEQHTLRSQTALTDGGTQDTASFTGADKLQGGDLTNDNLVDILDFGVLSGQFGSSPALDTWWTVKNADITCDGTVGTGDFTFMQQKFLHFGENLCAGAGASLASVNAPRASMTVREMGAVIGLPSAYKADMNKDGKVDAKDIALFMKQRASK